MTENETIEILESIYEKYVRDCGSDEEYMKNNLAITEAVKALSEIQQYRVIGTARECREAMERQREKKPIKDRYNHDCCPDCGWIVCQDEYGGRYLPHCENCGQAIDWSGIE